MNEWNISENRVEHEYKQLSERNRKRGYFLNPDAEFTKDLIRSLLINEKRYGYQSCPCRLATGETEEDLDIICPCDYRDADLSQYGTCFCGLYVSKEIAQGIKEVKSIPERRPAGEERRKRRTERAKPAKLPYPVWRCKVCGYLCARNEPPEICPVCGVSKERFEKFMQ